MAAYRQTLAHHRVGGFLPSHPCACGTGARSCPHQKVKTMRLEGLESLQNSNRSAIGELSTWFNGYRIGIDNDGNCFGAAWMVSVLLWAVQSKGRITELVKRLQDASKKGGAFCCLSKTSKVSSSAHWLLVSATTRDYRYLFLRRHNLFGVRLYFSYIGVGDIGSLKRRRTVAQGVAQSRTCQNRTLIAAKRQKLTTKLIPCPSHLQGHVAYLVRYAKGLENSWQLVTSSTSPTDHGTSLATRVVRVLRGSAGTVDGFEPLRLKRGLIIAARAFDVLAAPTCMEPKDLVSERAGAGGRVGVIVQCRRNIERACGRFAKYRFLSPKSTFDWARSTRDVSYVALVLINLFSRRGGLLHPGTARCPLNAICVLQ